MKGKDLTTEKMLNSVEHLFDQNHYSSEDLGEIITDGLKSVRRILGRINTISKEDPCCLPWVERAHFDRLLVEIEQFKQLKLQSERTFDLPLESGSVCCGHVLGIRPAEFGSENANP